MAETTYRTSVGNPAVLASTDLAVETHDLVRKFSSTEAVSKVTLSIRAGEFFSLLGPSGSGKTTLLRLIAGLDDPNGGWLRICGADASSIPAHQRPVSMVFQSYAIFPHLTVRQNVGFGLRLKKLPKSEINQRVARGLSMMQLERFADRIPAELSGGEKQRTALARAIVNEPRVLLLDEPLGALDLKLRKQLQQELRRLQRCLGISFIYVTHDQEEALTMSDRIAVMNQGRIEQVGTSEEIYERPHNRFVAEFVGSCNLFAATINADGNSLRAHTPVGTFEIAAGTTKRNVTLGIRPEKIHMAKAPASHNDITGEVVQVEYSGAATEYGVKAGNSLLKVVRANRPEEPLACVGEQVQLHFPPAALFVLED